MPERNLIVVTLSERRTRNIEANKTERQFLIHADEATRFAHIKAALKVAEAQEEFPVILTPTRQRIKLKKPHGERNCPVESQETGEIQHTTTRQQARDLFGWVTQSLAPFIQFIKTQLASQQQTTPTPTALSLDKPVFKSKH
jgi:hypothetical protein